MNPANSKQCDNLAAVFRHEQFPSTAALKQQTMSFSIDIREEAGVRTLHFGSDWIQGAMRIARPWNLELDYTREMMTSLLLREESRFPRRVLLIGLGAASLTKFLYRNQVIASDRGPKYVVPRLSCSTPFLSRFAVSV